MKPLSVAVEAVFESRSAVNEVSARRNVFRWIIISLVMTVILQA